MCREATGADVPRRTHPRFFISYCVDDKRFVYETCNILAPYLGRDRMFLFEKYPSDRAESFMAQARREVLAADGIVIFVGKRFGAYQFVELEWAKEPRTEDLRKIWIVGVGGQRSVLHFDDLVTRFAGQDPILVDDYTDHIPPATARCAEDLLKQIGPWWRRAFTDEWRDWDERRLLNGLPSVPQRFDYEKTIIQFYSAKKVLEKGGAGKENGDSAPESVLAGLLTAWPESRVKSLLEDGVPAQWPAVPRYAPERTNNLDQRIAGDFRGRRDDGEALVQAAALVALDSVGVKPTFPEAGPRSRLALPLPDARQLNVAIVVAGGIAPGINAVIDALVQRHDAYQKADEKTDERYSLNIFGLRNGFLAVSGDNASLTPHLFPLTPEDTVAHATSGGSMLGTSRDERLLRMEGRYDRLMQITTALSRPEQMFDILYVICGDGGMKAAHALWHCANRYRQSKRFRPLSVVTIPKTMDNDILWVWQSFGFLSAVDESRKIVETLHTEVRSNPRLGIVQLFGSDSGFVVSHAVLASAAGHATLALIPEIRFSAVGVARYLKHALWKSAKPPSGHTQSDPNAPIDVTLPHGLVVMAENAVPLDALECLGLSGVQEGGLPNGLEDVYKTLREELRKSGSNLRLAKNEEDQIKAFVKGLKERQPFEGQTSDTVRKVGLRIMAEVLPPLLRERGLTQGAPWGWKQPDWHRVRVVCSEPRHLVRALEPSTSDIITGQRLGLLAVDAAMAGYTDCMISQWLTEFAIVPLDLVVLGRKRIPSQGMFWKSIMSKTGQDPDLVRPYPDTR